jgi:hypothetical protein
MTTTLPTAEQVCAALAMLKLEHEEQAADIERLTVELQSVTNALGRALKFISVGEASLASVKAERDAMREPWQAMESAPRDGAMFLAVNMSGGNKYPNPYFLCFSGTEPGTKWAVGAGWKSPGRYWPVYPTHWTPIPEAPALSPVAQGEKE